MLQQDHFLEEKKYMEAPVENGQEDKIECVIFSAGVGGLNPELHT